MSNLSSKIGGKSVGYVKDLIVDVHLDYIEKDGYVWRYNEETKKYYNTGICLMGSRGNPGPRGAKGDVGLSAYLLAKERGFQGTVEQWLGSLKGKSAYEIAVENGFTGTVEEWLNTIVNEDISGKEDVVSIETVHQLASTTFEPEISKCYWFENAVTTLDVTLPADYSTKINSIILYLTTDSNPSISFNSRATVKYSSTYSIEANTAYEINCLFNGQDWIITSFDYA